MDRPQTVLLVDDEEDIRESLKALFETCLEGVRVIASPSGKDALEAMDANVIDLVITDFKMPGMNGLEFLARAGKAHPEVPRILVTAFPDLDIAIKAINEANIENFFTKPFEPDQVLGVVRQLLHEQRVQAMRTRSFARSLDLVRKNLEP